MSKCHSGNVVELFSSVIPAISSFSDDASAILPRALVNFNIYLLVSQFSQHTHLFLLCQVEHRIWAHNLLDFIFSFSLIYL